MKILLYLVISAILALLPGRSFAGGIGISPDNMKIEDLLKDLQDLNLPDLELYINKFNSPSGTDLILKYDALNNLQNTGNFEVIGVDPATFTNLSHTFESTPTLNSVQVKNFNFTVPVDAIHTDADERFIVLETDKTFDALAKDILIAPVFGQ